MHEVDSRDGIGSWLITRTTHEHKTKAPKCHYTVTHDYSSQVTISTKTLRIASTLNFYRASKRLAPGTDEEISRPSVFASSKEITETRLRLARPTKRAGFTYAVFFAIFEKLKRARTLRRWNSGGRHFRQGLGC